LSLRHGDVVTSQVGATTQMLYDDWISLPVHPVDKVQTGGLI